MEVILVDTIMKQLFNTTKIIGILLIIGCFFTCLAIQTKVSLRKDASLKQKSIPLNLFKEGDIIFQTTESRQCKAVQVVTKSIYSHVGIVFKNKEEWMVCEAVQPVKHTPLKTWVSNGKEGKYVVKRLENRDSFLTSTVLQKMKKIGKGYIGKNYDLLFGWSDNKIYCSELVWKIYNKGANIKVGELQKLKDFDLSQGIVKEIVEERYGDNIPWEETVISPANIFKSNNLVTVIQN